MPDVLSQDLGGSLCHYVHPKYVDVFLQGLIMPNRTEFLLSPKPDYGFWMHWEPSLNIRRPETIDENRIFGGDEADARMLAGYDRYRYTNQVLGVVKPLRTGSDTHFIITLRPDLMIWVIDGEADIDNMWLRFRGKSYRERVVEKDDCGIERIRFHEPPKAAYLEFWDWLRNEKYAGIGLTEKGLHETRDWAKMTMGWDMPSLVLFHEKTNEPRKLDAIADIRRLTLEDIGESRRKFGHVPAEREFRSGLGHRSKPPTNRAYYWPPKNANPQGSISLGMRPRISYL